MEQHNNDIDLHVDEDIYTCLNLASPKSFFLFAGAGSGKTRTLVNVLKKVNDNYGKIFKLRNKKIAVITYTNAAANEIIHRLEYSSIFYVSTIHSFSWDLIRNFTQDVKIWVQNNLNSEIAELEEQQSKSRDLNNKTSIGRAKKIESKKERLSALKGIKKFVYNPNGDNITKDSLNHSEVISITADFIKSKNLFKKILLNKFPIVLIDESQDTKKELIEALFELQNNYGTNFSLGLFGDTMQRIYADGKENLGVHLPESWLKPAKKMNHRSKSRIIELINTIRSGTDQQEQLWRTENTGGLVRFFAVSRTCDKEQTEVLIRQKMCQQSGDENWSGLGQNVKILTLEHHMAAKRMGFSNFFYPLYSVDKLKTGLLDGSLSSVGLFTKVILPVYKASLVENKFEIANLIKQHSPLVRKQVIQENKEQLKALHDTNTKVQSLLKLWSNENQPSLIEILQEINRSELFTIPDIFKHVLARASSENLDDDSEIENDDEILLAWEDALKSSFQEIVNYNEYISDKSEFGTHQGVKGLEFDRVMVIIDDDESKGFMFSYDKLFGIKQLTPTDEKNLKEGKETGVDRTTRLFYVACSRAKENLAIVAYSDAPEALKNNVVTFNWFLESEVEVIT
ncbi:UvrD-helicase domain-containing protein [Owenweeksia hongkongensis]|uniref:UvrD-helicase domain-containing protein n=1 Tax=Owenweeksia hongkongensis TaxID=253245 RepID=UPI003A8FA8AC